MCVYIVLVAMVTHEAPPIRTLRRVSVSLFLMAARQAEMTCALGLPTVSEKRRMREKNEEGLKSDSTLY